MNFRIGHGFDVHPLQKDCPFILGGILIKSTLGIKGHSDGDILMHAIVDALLGSLALGDIGTLFPSNQKWENCKSDFFLKEVLKKINKRNYQIVNIDTTIILQKPQINGYIPEMRKCLAEILNIDINQISIKATTTDYLGFIGEGKGVAALATILISRNKK